MIDQLESALRAAGHAIDLIVHETASINPLLGALGVVLYFVSQAVRTRGWHTILKAAYPDAPGFRARHTAAAYLAGAGLNAVIPARGGDVVKLALLHRRIQGSRYTTLAATFVPETLFETLFGIGLVVWALSPGLPAGPDRRAASCPHVDVSLIIAHPFLARPWPPALAVAGWLLVRYLRRAHRGLRGRASGRAS